MNQEEILKELNDKISQNPNDVEALGQRGMLYFELKKYKESLEDLDKAIEGGSLNPMFFFYRGKVKKAYVSHDESIEYRYLGNEHFLKINNLLNSIHSDFEKAIELNPNIPEFYYELAHRFKYDYDKFITRENLFRSIDYINKAIILDPNYLEAIALRADAYIGLAETVFFEENLSEKSKNETKKEFYEKALVDIQKLIDNSYDLKLNYYSKGVILADFNRDSDAYEAFNKAIELSNNDIPMYYYLERGKVNNKLNKYSDAINDFLKFLVSENNTLDKPIDNFELFWTYFVDASDIYEGKENDLFKELQIAFYHTNDYNSLLDFQNKLIQAERRIDYLLRAKAKSKLNDFIGSLEAFVEHEIINNGKEKDFIDEYKEAFDKTDFYKIAKARTEQLEIREFGPIKDINIEIKPITVIIGSTGSGKSTIIKLIHIFRQLFLNSDLTIDKFKETITDKFKLIEPIKETYIKYTLGDFFIEYTEGVLNTNFPNSFYNDYQKLKELSEKPSKEKGKFPLLKTWFEEAALTIHNPLYIPVERIFTTTYTSYSAAFQRSKIPIADFILQFIANKQLANGSVKKLDLPFLKATYFFRNNNDIIEHYGSDKLAIGLEYASSGFQSIIPLLLVFEHFSTEKDPFSYLFAVEEPELNLFPTVQKHIVEQMISKTIHSNCRLIMATHSPYILTALNNLIAAKTITKEQPQSTAKVNQIIPPQYQVDYRDVMAYYVTDGTAKNIMNEEYSMIDANALDDVSNELGQTFDELLNLRYPD